MTADIGYGTEFAIGDGGGPETFTNVAEVGNIVPPQYSRDAIDVTTNDSASQHREYIGGLRDGGDASFELLFTPSASDTILAAYDTDANKNYRVTFDNGVTCTFAGVMTSYTPSAPLDDKMTATVTIKVSGKPTWA